MVMMITCVMLGSDSTIRNKHTRQELWSYVSVLIATDVRTHGRTVKHRGS